jgi:hypothetical protein
MVSYPRSGEQQTKESQMVINAETSVAAAPTNAPAPSSTSDPKIVDAIQAHLEAFAEAVEPSDTPEATVEATEPEVSPAGEKTESGEAPVVDKSEEKPVEEAAAEPEVSAEASTLPAAYVRTAKARGWTDQEITDFQKAQPEMALKTFERMHESRTKEIQEWAELGRKTRQASAPAVPAAASPEQTAPVAGLQPINVQEMVAKYGNEDLIREMAGPINAAIAALGPIVQGATAAQEQAKRAAQEQLGRTVENFFTDKSMAPYAEAYGTTMATLTTPQIGMRQKVLETADALIAGAGFQGRQLSVQDALMLAHDSVASGMKETIIRDQIRSNVKKRAASITLKPTAQGRTNPGAAPRDRTELLSRTDERLAKVFG